MNFFAQGWWSILFLDDIFTLGSWARWHDLPTKYLKQGVRIILILDQALQTLNMVLIQSSLAVKKPLTTLAPYLIQSLQGSYTEYHFWHFNLQVTPSIRSHKLWCQTVISLLWSKCQPLSWFTIFHVIQWHLALGILISG